MQWLCDHPSIVPSAPLKRRPWCAFLLLVLVGFMAWSCSTSQKPPNLGDLYNRLARHETHERNPVILIPGLMGSKLKDTQTGNLVWGAFGSYDSNPNTARGARLMALPMRAGKPLRDLKDTVQPDGALDQVVIDVAGYPFHLNAYAYILAVLGAGGYRDQQLAEAGVVDYGDQHFTCFQFDYDWRRDIVENAQRLDLFIREKRAYVQQEIEKRYGVKAHDVRFDIVAHSMGGLVARYYARYDGADLPEGDRLPEITWSGGQYIANLIMVGTPNAGSIEALQSLVNGYQPAALLPGYAPAILGTTPSLYQMLPRTRHEPLQDHEGQPVGDIFALELWRDNGWGLADPRQERVLEFLLPETEDPVKRMQIALDHLSKSLQRARKFSEAMDVPAEPPSSMQLLLIAGDSIQTPRTLQFGSKKGLKVVRRGPGDGVVLRSSALLDERRQNEIPGRLISPIYWDRVLFLFDDHLKLTQNPNFMDNLLFHLLESQQPG